jgi:DNA-binding response OmpR family regulator
MRVLIVSRDRELQVLRAQVVKLSGMHAITPGSTEEAAAVIWTAQLDALVLCYSLPNKDAIFLAELFRQFRPKGCVVAITNHGVQDHRIDADVQIPATAEPDLIIAAIKQKCAVHAA